LVLNTETIFSELNSYIGCFGPVLARLLRSLFFAMEIVVCVRKKQRKKNTKNTRRIGYYFFAIESLSKKKEKKKKYHMGIDSLQSLRSFFLKNREERFCI